MDKREFESERRTFLILLVQFDVLELCMCRRIRGLSGLAAAKATDALSVQEADAVDDGDDDADDEEDHIGDGPFTRFVPDEDRKEMQARHRHLN